MGNSVIILAGGPSSRIGQDKGLLRLGDRPLVKHVLDRVASLADEIIVVVSSGVQANSYAKLLGSSVAVLVDAIDLQSPLVGALAGFEAAQRRYSLLLPCDAPFVSRDVLSLFFDLCIGKNAVIPRWPSCYIEPLQAVYCTEPALEAAKSALSMGELNLQAMVNRLHGIRYVSTLVIQELDPQLKTFFNINTLVDLKKAELMLRRKTGRSS